MIDIKHSTLNKGKVRFAVIGCGHIGKRHIEMIRRNPDCELVAVCDILPYEKLGLDSLSISPSQFVQNLNDLLNQFDFDVLNICTPNGLHASMAIEGLNSGHHVVIEKPMALNTEDAQAVLDAAEKNRKQVFCVMQNRYSPPSVWLKNLIESNKLGDIYMVQVNCYWNRDERYYKSGNWHGTKNLDGGTLFTQFSHFIDLMYWLFGDITDIQARFDDFNHQQLTDFEDSGFVSFRFNKGGIGMFNYSTAVYNKNFESSVVIVGQNGTVKVGGQYMNEVEYCHIKDYEMPDLAPTNPGNDYGAYKGSAQNHHYIIENVVNVLRNDKPEDITTNAYEGYKVVDMIERIYKS
jgi:Predicted dehydrogenases and related proteins